MKKSSSLDISVFQSGTVIYIMQVCTTLIALRPRNLHGCFRTDPYGREFVGVAVLRNSIKVPSNSVPSRARNNSRIEFQGNVIATVLFAVPYCRHDHYFSNYNISRLPRITRSTANDGGAENGDEMSWNCSKDLPTLVDLIAMRKA